MKLLITASVLFLTLHSCVSAKYQSSLIEGRVKNQKLTPSRARHLMKNSDWRYSNYRESIYSNYPTYSTVQQ